MYSQCPHCLTVFVLRAQTLARARGDVTCGSCGQVFDALASLHEHLPPVPFRELPLTEAEGIAPLLDEAVYRPAKETEPPQPEDIEPHLPLPGQEDFSQLVFASHTKVKNEAHPRMPRRWPWVLAILVLLALLGMQLSWLKRAALLRNPVIGTWLHETCDMWHCHLPQLRDVSQLHLLAQGALASPEASGALRLSFTVQNEAPFDQPYPTLVITLADERNKPYASRRLQPTEYLDDPALLRRGFPAGTSTTVLVELHDPGAQATHFTVAFE